MRIGSCCTTLLLALALAAPASISAQVLRPVVDIQSREVTPPIASLRASTPSAGNGAPMARWLKWGIVGAAAGALTFPLLSGLASDQSSHPAQAAIAGAVTGFVIVGGGIALWDAMCGHDTSSRRAGLCGR